MPENQVTPELESVHSEDMDDIIKAVPSWLIRWGILVFLFQLALILLLSAFIEYPDVVRLSLRINSQSRSLTVLSDCDGRIIRTMIKDNQQVKKGQALFIIHPLKIDSNATIPNAIQTACKGEIFSKIKINQINNVVDTFKINMLKPNLREEFYKYNSLAKYKTNNTNQTLFYQQQNRVINLLQKIKVRIFDENRQQIIYSTRNGVFSYVHRIKENQLVLKGEEIFYISDSNPGFFGRMFIPVNNTTVRRGQTVIIKLKGFPYQTYGTIRGEIAYISTTPLRDSVLVADVDLDLNSMNKFTYLKPGMTADAEVITLKTTLLKRIGNNLVRR